MTTEQIEDLLRLKKENPELEIVWMVNYEVCAEDTHQYWQAFVYEIKKGIYALLDDRIYTDTEELEEDIADRIWDFGRTEEENNKVVQEELSKIEKKDAIFVYLDV